MCYAEGKYRQAQKGNLQPKKMIQILFVCLGNICRSPLAEAIFKHKIRSNGLESLVFCDSAGTADYHVGENPDPRTIEVAARYQVPVQHKGQQFTTRLARDFHYLIAMDQSNYVNMVRRLGGDADNLYLMRHFDPLHPNSDVPDPYYGGTDGFEEVYQILDRSLDHFLEFLKRQHNF